MARQYDYEEAHDERLDPNADLDETHGGMPVPDWNRALVHGSGKTMPVGDPTVWGGNITTQIDNDPVLGATPRLIAGQQIILAQGRDRYARSWSLTGVLWLPPDPIIAPSPDPLPPGAVNPLPSAADPELVVWLSVTMGVERMQQTQQILLFAGDQAQNYGLCWNQHSANNGPYGGQIVPTPLQPTSRFGLPFACIGAFIGNTISAQALYVRGGAGLGVTVPDARITCMVTPYAPGAGI